MSNKKVYPETDGTQVKREAGDTLTYDAENRLQSVTSGSETVSFTYDGDGRRVLRDTETETVAYAGRTTKPATPKLTSRKIWTTTAW